MPTKKQEQLSRRERQIIDILLELEEASVEDVRSRLPDPPSYSAARAMLKKLEDKGHVKHDEKGLRYVYRATMSRADALESSVDRLAKIFFDGSVARAVEGMIDRSARDIPSEELDRLAAAIERARRERDDE